MNLSIKNLYFLVFFILVFGYCVDAKAAESETPAENTRNVTSTEAAPLNAVPPVGSGQNSLENGAAVNTVGEGTLQNAQPNDSVVNNSTNVENGKEGLQKSAQKNEVLVGSVLDVRAVSKQNGLFDLIFTVDREFIADVKVLNFPFRLMIDIPMPYKWAAANDQVKKKIPLTLIQGFRYGNPSRNVFRIVADLGRSLSVNRAYVLERSDGTYDFIIEISLLSNPRNSVVVSNSIVYANKPSVLREISAIAQEREQEERRSKNASRISERIKEYLQNVSYPKPQIDFEDRKIVVVLDPGHGGKDPGATSADSSLVEKRLVLLVANKIKRKLQNNPDISVVLTRDADHYIPLKDRIFWAEYFRGDIFISLHADNSETSLASSGLSIYTLSEIASDAQTQLLANNANRSDITAGIELSRNDEEVNRILVSLSQRVRVNESIDLSRSIVRYASQSVKILQNPARSAGFAVLKIPNIPSILIELGFLSNSDDVANFKDEEYLDRLAESISVGVQAYLWEKGRFPTIPKSLLDSSKNISKARNLEIQEPVVLPPVVEEQPQPPVLEGTNN